MQDKTKPPPFLTGGLAIVKTLLWLQRSQPCLRGGHELMASAVLFDQTSNSFDKF